MKAVVKLLIFAAFFIALGSLAYGSSITLGSYGTGQNPQGAANSALAYLGYDANTPIITGIGSGATYNLNGDLSPWAGPISGSSWVSEDPHSTIAGGSAPPNGYYTYTTTFDATPGSYSGSLAIYADDTAEVFLNGALVLAFDTNTHNGPCALDHNGPGCVGDPFQAIFDVTLQSENVLTIVDWQSNGWAAGIDFDGTLSGGEPNPLNATPEPGSLLLLGTGLSGLAALISRKMKAR
jgi:hypothetical protein